MSHETHIGQVLVEGCVARKLQFLEAHLHALLRGGTGEVPIEPGRDVQIVHPREMPPKLGVSTKEGQARLIHDLASIELQAMELGVRSLIEFPDAPSAFRAELAQVTQEEGIHLGMCIQALNDLGFPWGSFPTHNGLWFCVSPDDSLLDRIVIVHRFLEGSGLDASAKILRRLEGVGAREAVPAVERIGRDEVRHVQFGSRWFHKLVEGDAGDDFRARMMRLFDRIPRRLEPINAEIRREAGFTDAEVSVLRDLRERQLNEPCARM